MEALHIEEDIYRQIAEYIEDNALPYIRGWHSEARATGVFVKGHAPARA